jgi:hypothetical protein
MSRGSDWVVAAAYNMFLVSHQGYCGGGIPASMAQFLVRYSKWGSGPLSTSTPPNVAKDKVCAASATVRADNGLISRNRTSGFLAISLLR